MFRYEGQFRQNARLSKADPQLFGGDSNIFASKLLVWVLVLIKTFSLMFLLFYVGKKVRDYAVRLVTEYENSLSTDRSPFKPSHICS